MSLCVSLYSTYFILVSDAGIKIGVSQWRVDPKFVLRVHPDMHIYTRN